MSTIGVVVPAHNVARWLPATLASLARQELTDWTCVIVDDGSSDDTLVVAREIAVRDRRVVVVSQNNAGVSSARNTGLGHLKGVDLVLFLDSDDILLPGALTRLVDALERRPDAVGAYGLAEYIDGSGQRIRDGEHPAKQRRRNEFVAGRAMGRLREVAPTRDLTVGELMLANPVWPPAAAVLRIDAVRAAGGFDESYRVQEDWELWLRMARGGPFIALDTVVAEYRQHGANLTGDTFLNLTTQARLRAAAFRSLGPAEADAFAPAWRRMLLSRLHHAVRLSTRAARSHSLRDVFRGLAVATYVVWQLLRRTPRAPRGVFDLTLRWEKDLDKRLIGPGMTVSSGAEEP